MEEIASRIELYHNLFTGCLAISLICLILAAVLFFVLDIKDVLGYLSGRQRRKKVKEMEAANAVSGRLMRERSSMQHVSPEMKTDMGVRQAPIPGARKVGHVVEESPPGGAPVTQETAGRTNLTETEIINSRSTEPLGESEATTLLAQDEATALLTEETATSLLQEDGSTESLNKPAVRGRFLIEREIILIHTEEVI